jgi:pentatricopeptide repeat protein
MLQGKCLKKCRRRKPWCGLWNSLICGYAQNGSLGQVVDLFRETSFMDVKPDRFTVSGSLSACAQTGA